MAKRKEVIAEFKKFGRSVENLSLMFGISEQMVRIHLRGCVKTKTEKLADKIWELTESGMSQRRIAKELDVAIPTVRWHLKKGKPRAIWREDFLGHKIAFKTVSEVARHYGVTTKTVEKWCDSGMWINGDRFSWVIAGEEPAWFFGTDIDGDTTNE